MSTTEALQRIEELLTNLQPHIAQACEPGRAGFIDNYVDPALEIARAALAAAAPSPATAGGAEPVAAEPMKCGHPRWLALQSVESDTVLCELCEMRQQRDDAVLMEQELQERVRQLSRALADAVDSPTHMGEPVLPYRSKRGECAACEERFQALQARLSEEKAALATPAPAAQQPAALTDAALEKCERVAKESGAWESYKAVGEAFAELRSAIKAQGGSQ